MYSRLDQNLSQDHGLHGRMQGFELFTAVLKRVGHRFDCHEAICHSLLTLQLEHVHNGSELIGGVGDLLGKVGSQLRHFRDDAMPNRCSLSCCVVIGVILAPVLVEVLEQIDDH